MSDTSENMASVTDIGSSLKPSVMRVLSTPPLGRRAGPHYKAPSGQFRPEAQARSRLRGVLSTKEAPATTCSSEELAVDIRDALSRLSPRDFQIVTMISHGHTYDEVQTAMSVARQTISAALKRARALLQGDAPRC